MDDRLAKVEELLAHHEQKIDDLSDVVQRQWDEIDILKKRSAGLQARIGELEDSAKDGGGDDKGLSVTEIAARNKPPHY